MPSSSGSRFRLDEHDLQSSALRAQVLERCRRTLRHDMNNAVQSIHSGLELLAKCIATPGIVRVTPQECIALLQQQFVTLRQTLDRLVDDIAEPPGEPESFDLSALTSEALHLLRHERAASKAKRALATDTTVTARKVNVRTAVLALLLDTIDHLSDDGGLEVAVVRKDRLAVLEISGPRRTANVEDVLASPLVRMLKHVLAEDSIEIGVSDAGGAIRTALYLPSSAQESSTLAPTAGPVRVLIADRTRDAADSLAMILQLEGMEARTVYSGAQLHDALAAFAPDIALIDVDLPGCDVYEVARTVRAQGTRRPVLAQVSSTDREKHAVFDAHLLRPVEWPQLQTLIAQARNRS